MAQVFINILRPKWKKNPLRFDSIPTVEDCAERRMRLSVSQNDNDNDSDYFIIVSITSSSGESQPLIGDTKLELKPYIKYKIEIKTVDK